MEAGYFFLRFSGMHTLSDTISASKVSMLFYSLSEFSADRGLYASHHSLGGNLNFGGNSSLMQHLWPKSTFHRP
jgi:hypothetical protein